MNKIQILIVCRQSKVLFAKGCVRGAHNSRHSHSVALAKRMNNESGWLAQIIYFVECVVPKTGTSNQHFTHWVAAVHWFMDHPYKIWYGDPTHVARILFPGSFIHSCDRYHTYNFIYEVIGVPLDDIWVQIRCMSLYH